GFAKYDLLAARSRTYALIYPFLELGLSLAYLSRWQTQATYFATIVILSFGALGVLNTMRQGKRINCACMGKILEVPVSTVTLTENLSMSVMALAMLLI
ncbi:MAG: MauE/DoxX family redox-associated membrane protein, partial [Akkermansiaceae bacterium]|nr:MauE/DoxX family redox-associated membrane protein [Akkermansiaceae bacterium]